MSQTVQIYIKQRKTRNEKIHRHKSLSLFQMNHIRLQSKVSSFTSWKALSTNGSLKKKKKKKGRGKETKEKDRMKRRQEGGEEKMWGQRRERKKKKQMRKL